MILALNSLTAPVTTRTPVVAPQVLPVVNTIPSTAQQTSTGPTWEEIARNIPNNSDPYTTLDWMLGRTPYNAGPDRHLIDAVVGGGINGFNSGAVNSTSGATGVGMGGGPYDPFAVALGSEFGSQFT
jgi:hypothetical protein